MLRLSNPRGTTAGDGRSGYARYRIDFENIDLNDKFVLAWVSPRYPELEFREYLDRIKGWWTGWNREIWQEDITEIQPFKWRLYRLGLKDEDCILLEEATYASLQPA